MITCKEADFLAYMSDVEKYSGRFAGLNDQWDNIKLLCEINIPEQAKKILPNMTKIQNSFFHLQQELIETLIAEALHKMQNKIGLKAQVAVDILIRNLYERTADVGFIATDDDIRQFVCAEERTEEERDCLVCRLREYVEKYSVYDEIIILDKHFTVLANLDESNPITGTTLYDPLLAETLECETGFVETFRPSVLQSGKKTAHIFSSKICKEGSREAAGIVCLCFRFENELGRIFRKLSTDYDGSVLMIIDRDNTVIASSDENHVPVGIRAEPVDCDGTGIVYYRGMEYIAKTLPTVGYQGYYGLGWKGHLMIPLQLAFKEKSARSLSEIDKEILSGLMNKSDSFSKALHEIVMQAERINQSLTRIVFNGQLLARSGLDAENAKLIPLLDSIGTMGTKTSQLFDKSIKNLFATVISSGLRNVGVIASLAIDITDRNLYERANDCRWWALNSTFRRIMAKGEISEEDAEKLTGILSYINSLYTVYSNLFLFDKSGKIIAVSNPERSADIGRVLSGGYIESILTNSFAEKYFVSPFEPSELYDGRYTYIYGASVTDIDNEKHTVGGIGIVFDSEFQFNAILNDSLPSKENTFAVFTDRKGKIISSTSEKLETGGFLNLSAELLETPDGQTCSQILIYDGCYHAVGCSCSSGYREYKHSDGYRNDVLAFVFDKLADYDESDAAAAHGLAAAKPQPMVSENKAHISLVTFTIGGYLFGINRQAVLEAIDAESVISLPGSDDILGGAVRYNDRYVAVIDTHFLFHQKTSDTGTSHLLMVRAGDGTCFALEADELVNLLEIDEGTVEPVPGIGQTAVSVIKGIVCLNDKKSRIMLILNHETLPDRLDPELLRGDWEEVLPVISEESVL